MSEPATPTQYDISTPAAARATAERIIKELEAETDDLRAQALIDHLTDIVKHHPSLTLPPLPARYVTKPTKNPWLAAALNAWPIPLGLGYIYLKKWSRFGLTILLQLVVIPFVVEQLGFSQYLGHVLCILWFIIVIDAYQTAKSQ